MPADAVSNDTDGAPGTYAKGIARRQEILDRAIEVFAARGATGTSLRAIAQAIGVSHGALTHYFTSREQLLVEVYREAEARRPPADPDESLSPVRRMTKSAELNRSVPGLVQLYTTLVATALEDGHPEATTFITERFRDVRGRLTAQIERTQAEGLLRADLSPATVASLIIAASDGVQTQWLLDPSVDHAGALAALESLLSPHD